MLLRMTYRVFAIFLLAAAPAFGADSGSAAKLLGPRVEITLRESHAVYSCCLLAFDKQVLTLMMESGTRRQENISNVESIRFLSPPMPTASMLKAKPGGPLNSQETDRLADLLDKDKDEVLSEAETDEMLRLRVRAPVFSDDAPKNKLLRMPSADEMAHHEFVRNRIDAYINELQIKTKFAKSEDEIQDSLLMLGLAYRYKGLLFTRARDVLKEDAASIVDPQLRKKAIEFFEKIEPLRLPQQFPKKK